MATIRSVIFGIVLCSVLAACASSAKGRVEGGLKRLGMPDRSAHCMADELDDRLSRQDMKTLARLLEEAGTGKEARPARILDFMGDLDDPDITEAAARSGIRCTILG